MNGPDQLVLGSMMLSVFEVWLRLPRRASHHGGAAALSYHIRMRRMEERARSRVEATEAAAPLPVRLDCARPDSDVDLFLKLTRRGSSELVGVKDDTARIFGRKADIMTRDSTYKAPRERIEVNAVPHSQLRAPLRGRPPLAPFARAAADFAGDFTRPATRASSRVIHERVPKIPDTSAGT